MAVLFLVLIVLFAIGSGVYLYRNDFAQQTIDVVFPAIGAILLSTYLGVKTVFLDRPKPKTIAFVVPVLRDGKTGTLRMLGPHSPKHMPRADEFRGIDTVTAIPQYQELAGLDLASRLRDTGAGPNDPAFPTIQQIVEYALVQWLAGDGGPGSEMSRTVQLINSGGAFGKGGRDLVEVATDPSLAIENPLFRARPIRMALPKRSAVLRAEPMVGRFVLRTCHSTLRFRQLGASFERLAPPVGDEATRISRALNLPSQPEGLTLYGIRYELEADQVPYLRYSRQATLEAHWLDRLLSQAEMDFSWERLRRLYATE